MIPYGKLAIAVIVILALAASYLQGRKDGGAIVRVDYAARDLKAANDYAQKEREITEAYRKKEGEWSQQVAAVGKKLQVERSNHETTKVASLAAIDAGTLRLRLSDSADCKAAGSGTPAPSSATSRSNGDAEGRFLGKADSAFLVAEASRADQVVIQLQACQQVLIDERK
jgi:murein L,D-transpeptidase YcbB/YkuD